jgi:type I restriction enzyme R subunit
LDEILSEIQNFPGTTLHEANKAIHRLLLKGTTVNKNELSGEINPTVRLVDFRNWDKNSFIAINQFRLLTPGKPSGNYSRYCFVFKWFAACSC